ncbi:hypothetical protein QT738_22520, partial [Xanthomonas citri pv. citri]
MTNKSPFKVKCVIEPSSGTLTEGRVYEVVSVEQGVDKNYYKVVNNNGKFHWYYDSRFEMVETPLKNKQEFSVGDKVVINEISDDFVSSNDESVKVGDVATVTFIENNGDYDIRLTNPNWKNAWWFSKADVSLVADNNPLNDKSQDYHILSHQEVVQAVLDGKELEIQYTDGTWNAVL